MAAEVGDSRHILESSATKLCELLRLGELTSISAYASVQFIGRFDGACNRCLSSFVDMLERNLVLCIIPQTFLGISSHDTPEARKPTDSISLHFLLASRPPELERTPPHLQPWRPGVAVLEAFIAKVEADPLTNAVVVKDYGTARTRAARADECWRCSGGRSLWGRLHGLPMTVKEEVQVQGLCSHRADGDGEMDLNNCVAVQRLLDEGAIIFGKTNTPSRCRDWQTYNETCLSFS